MQAVFSLTTHRPELTHTAPPSHYSLWAGYTAAQNNIGILCLSKKGEMDINSQLMVPETGILKVSKQSNDIN